MILQARPFTWTFPRPALLMGIVNVTPDSFSDGGRYLDPEAAVQHGLELIQEGADILDVGGESTRPQATPVPEAEELRRVLPVIEGLAAAGRVPISIDTMKPAVARAAIRAGASLINDVAANRAGAEMAEVVAESGAGYVLMHMQGTPATMQSAPSYRDVGSELDDFFRERLERLRAAGVKPEQVILDVGLGFGKTAEHNLQLLAMLSRFKKWDRPLLLGASRKSFLGKISPAAEETAGAEVTGGAQAPDRLGGSLACACWAVQQGVSLLRIHDVAATRQAVRLTEAILAQTALPQPRDR